jgi:hypothetical protein
VGCDGEQRVAQREAGDVMPKCDAADVIEPRVLPGVDATQARFLRSVAKASACARSGTSQSGRPADGAEAVELARSSELDLYLFDIEMPKLDLPTCRRASRL